MQLICNKCLKKSEKVIVDNIFNHKKRDLTHFGYFWFGFVMFNATFNNNLVISWRSVLLVLVEETVGPGEGKF